MTLNFLCGKPVLVPRVSARPAPQDDRFSRGIVRQVDSSDRKVPLHSKLIEAGLLDFVEHHKSEWLFPVLKPGGPDNKRSWYISKRFTEHRRDLKVIRLDPVTGKDRVDFPSLRRSVVKVLERARVAQTEAAQVIGHDREGITFGVYNPEGLDIHALQQVVESIKYPELS